MNKQRLTIEDRMLIEELLKNNYKLKDIAKIIEVYPSTISREVRNRKISNNMTKICNKTLKFPFVCNGCEKKQHAVIKNISIIMLMLRKIMLEN